RSISWARARDEYLTQIAGKRRAKTYDNYRRFLAYFKFQETKLTDITHQDIERILAKLSDRPTTQFCSYRVLTGFFKWAYRKRYLEQKPTEPMEAPDRYKDRERTLTNEELVQVFRTAGDDTYGRIVRTLTILGQRGGKFSSLSLATVTENSITFPPSLT